MANKTKKYKHKKLGGLQRTKNYRHSSSLENSTKRKRSVRFDVSPSIKKDKNSEEDDESDNEDNNTLSTMSKRFWSLLGY